jgi:hypothetical protein
LVWFSCSYFGSELLQLPEKKTLCQLKIVPIHRRRKGKICVTRCVTRVGKNGRIADYPDDRDSDSRRLNAAVCAQLMTISEFLQECRFRL